MQNFPFRQTFLKNQKILKRVAKASKRHNKNSGLKLIPLAIIITCLSFSFLSKQINQAQTLKTNITPNWDIEINSNVENKGLTEHKFEVLDAITKEGTKLNSLPEITSTIQKQFYFARTSIIKTAPNKLKIYIEERIPALSISADKKRFVATTGDVYGEYHNKKTEKLPHLVGVFEKKRKPYVFSNANALITTEQEQARIQEALTIVKLSKKFLLLPKQLKFIEYRGFSLTLEKQKTEVLLGRKPFEYKFVKLVEIQKQTKKNKQHAWKIELDYEGKAFIKTSKIGNKVDS